MLHAQTSGTKGERASSGLYAYRACAMGIPAGSGDSYRKCLRRFDYTAVASQLNRTDSSSTIVYAGVLEYHCPNLICLMPAPIG
jgi:hypothetical protein